MSFDATRLSRRRLLAQGAGGLLGTALGFLSARDAAAADPRAAQLPHFTPRVKRAIWLFMSGGPSQLDLFDYKPGLSARFDQDLPPSVRGAQRLSGLTSDQARFPIAPSQFAFKQGGASGAWVSDLLPWTRKIVDELAILRTVSTESINHEPALLNMNTGSPLTGKPALGAWLSYGLGRLSEDLPAFVVMQSRFSTSMMAQPVPSRVWSSTFLPDENAGVSVRGTGDPVLFLNNPPGVDSSARRTMLDGLRKLNEIHARDVGSASTSARTEQYELAFRMQASAPALTNLSEESPGTLRLYGDDAATPGTFAANCVAARRMLERGVRFVQIFHRGWDAHFTTPENHRTQCRDVDQACYGLITDLKQRGMLEDTLVIWGGEFGRTVYSQGTLTKSDYGRDHHPRCNAMWLAGGGVKHGIVFGTTDDFSYNVVEDELPLRDLHATILALFGLDAQRLSVRHAGLNEKLVGVGAPARVVDALLA